MDQSPFSRGDPGNKEADTLADAGWLSSPLLTQSLVSTARRVRCSVPSQGTNATTRHDEIPCNVISACDSDFSADDEALPTPTPFDSLLQIMSRFHL